MLLDEAKIYNAFPRDLQDGNTPIVPKFYGYYVRSTEVFDRDDGNNGGDNDLEKCWKSFQTVLLNSITSILLLEACGKPVNTDCLALSQRWARNLYKITLTEKDQPFDFGKQAGHRETFETFTQSELCARIILRAQHTHPAWSAYPASCRTQLY
jgi:hypothetical protein